MQGLDLVFELFDEVQIGGSNLGVVGLYVGIFFSMFGCKLLNFIVLFVLQLLNQIFTIVIHLTSHFLHFQVVFFL